MHDWAAWGTCSFTCGGGTKTRYRTVSRPASHGGKPCPSNFETSSCRTQPCPVDCVPSQWGDWGACTTTCGGGLRTRTRKITTPAMHGGRLCSLTDTLKCATQACPAPTPAESHGRRASLTSDIRKFEHALTTIQKQATKRFQK